MNADLLFTRLDNLARRAIYCAPSDQGGALHWFVACPQKDKAFELLIDIRADHFRECAEMLVRAMDMVPAETR